MELIHGEYKVEWVDIGEGWDGDYNPNNPDDTPLLRFDTYRKDGDEWEAIDDGSYCTAMPVGTPDNILQRALQLIVADLNAVVDLSPKRALEGLSWMNPTWFEEVK